MYGFFCVVMANCVESCLDGIVTVSDVCSGTRECSSSGYDLMDAPEISINNLAAIANEKYISGLNLARSIVINATRMIKNDLIATLNTNGILTNVQNAQYTTSFNNNAIVPASALERGITLFRNPSIRGNLKKVLIQKVEIYPSSSGNTVLKVYDNGLVSSYSISLVAGQINEFQINHEMSGNYARVLVDNSTIDMYSTTISCKTGCGGSAPNPCGYAQSYDGTSENRSAEGYGLNVYFSCQCNYDEFMCDLSQTYVGELIWLKSRIMLIDEQLRTNRFNDWVTYNRTDLLNFKADLTNQYVNRWNALVSGMYGILQNYRDDCIICRGIQWVVNG